MEYIVSFHTIFSLKHLNTSWIQREKDIMGLSNWAFELQIPIQ